MDKVREITLQRHPVRNFSIEVGDTAKVSIKVKEGSKERIQIFEGVVLKIQGKDFDRSFTVRKISNGVGVEKTIPISSPNVTNVEIVSRSKVRRARLFYLRNLTGKAARLTAKKFQNPKLALKDNKEAADEKKPNPTTEKN